jgi:hypothetical protein
MPAPPPPDRDRIAALEGHSATLSRDVSSTNEQVGRLKQAHSLRLFWHKIALGFEAVGTLFIFLDTRRLSARTPPEGFTLGDPIEFRHWYFHCAALGFGLLFLGILVSASVLWREHVALGEDDHVTQQSAAGNSHRRL